MATPRAIILSGYGLNCEEDTKFAFEQAGGNADIVHINDLIESPEQLANYQIMALPGGFSYGDDTGSGKAFANKMRHHLGDRVNQFVQKDTLVIGICNGFQIISHLGLVPAINENFGQPAVALTNNDSARYLDRWVDVRVDNESPWLRDIKGLALPIAHGEGKLFAESGIISNLKANHQIALTYTRGEVSDYLDLPANPNGSAENIAGISDASGRILGLMPHPERAVAFTHLPHWPMLAYKYRQRNETLPTAGPGAQLFTNAVTWFK